ncbi:MAG TPA: ATP-binding protein [Burkholderiaceae bacterium]
MVGRPVPLRRRLFLQFFGISLLPLLAVVLIIAAVMAKALVSEVERQTATLGVAVRDQVEEQLAGRQASVALTGFVVARQPEPAAQGRFMRAVMRVDAKFDALYITDANGIVSLVALGASPAPREADLLGIDLASRPFYKAARAAQAVVWSDTFLSTLTGRVTAVVAAPVGDGMLVAELSLLSLSKTVGSLTSSTGDLVVIIDSQGRIIGHPDAALAARQVSLGHTQLVREGMAGRDANGRFDWDGTAYLGSVSHIGRTGWSVLVARPSAQVYGPLYQLGWAVAGGVVLALTGALVAALLLARTAERRYRQLIEAADSYVQDEAPPPVTFDILEFDQLWRKLRHLFEQIGQRDAETRAARAQLQNVFDATTEVSIIATRSDGVITVFNRGAEKMLGYDAAAMVGQRGVLMLHDESELRQRGRELSAQLGHTVEGFEILAAVAREAGYEVRDWTYMRRNGTRLSVSVAFTAVRDGDTEPAGFLAIATDQSEHHRAAGLEVARQVAEASSQYKSEFLSRVSHDLRTPLNAMLGFAQLLAMDTTEPLTKVQRDRVALIATAGWHLVRLIDDVLDLSRIESGNLRISMEAVDLLPAIDDAVRLVSEQASVSGITISQQLPSDPHTVQLLAWADRTRLIQVFVNLLSNAIKYNLRGGQVGILVDAVDPQQLRIEFTDTGRGMSAHQLARLFEPFNRLGMEASPIEGTGIGLVIVRRLLDLMDGDIEVRSRPGAGTRMTVRIRRSVQVPAALAVAATAALESGSRHEGSMDVVCVEDNPVNSVLMGQVFALRPACRLHMAATAELGLSLIRRLRPRLVMLDVHLPDGSGVSMLEQMRLEPELAATPVIVVSADATTHNVRAAQAAGARAFLSKPIQIAQALKEIDAALGRAEEAPAA